MYTATQSQTAVYVYRYCSICDTAVSAYVSSKQILQYMFTFHVFDIVGYPCSLHATALLTRNESLQPGYYLKGSSRRAGGIKENYIFPGGIS